MILKKLSTIGCKVHMMRLHNQKKRLLVKIDQTIEVSVVGT